MLFKKKYKKYTFDDFHIDKRIITKESFFSKDPDLEDPDPDYTDYEDPNSDYSETEYFDIKYFIAHTPKIKRETFYAVLIMKRGYGSNCKSAYQISKDMRDFFVSNEIGKNDLIAFIKASPLITKLKTDNKGKSYTSPGIRSFFTYRDLKRNEMYLY